MYMVIDINSGYYDVMYSLSLTRVEIPNTIRHARKTDNPAIRQIIYLQRSALQGKPLIIIIQIIIIVFHSYITLL